MSKLEEIIERITACNCGIDPTHFSQAISHVSGCPSRSREICRRAVRGALREVAKLARYPYADQVGAYGSDEPCAVGLKIGLAIGTLAAELEEK